MSTRSYVGILKENNVVKFVYNHHDSHPETLGQDLFDDFNTSKKVEELIDKGDGSYIISEHYTPKENPFTLALSEFKPVSDIEFCYLFENGKWKVRGHKYKEWTDLEKILKGLKNESISY